MAEGEPGGPRKIDRPKPKESTAPIDLNALRNTPSPLKKDGDLTIRGMVGLENTQGPQQAGKIIKGMEDHARQERENKERVDTGEINPNLRGLTEGTRSSSRKKVTTQ